MTNKRAFLVSLGIGKVAEGKVALYLKALGYHVLPTTDFSRHGAPKLEAENAADSIVMPDLQAFGDGVRAWFEVKWKTCAVEYRHKGSRLETGIGLRHYGEYLDAEERTQMPVVLVFVHEKERQVRCASLAQLIDAFSHDDNTDKMERGGMRFWIFEKIPLWMTLDELEARVAAHELNAKLIDPPIPPPVDARMVPHAMRRHGSFRHAAPPPWTVTCLPCNWTGLDATKHVCEKPLEYATNYWTKRLTIALRGNKEAATVLLSRPIGRARLAELLGSTWMPSGDVS